MTKSVLTKSTSLILTLTIIVPAQQVQEKASPFAAIVRELRGKCVVRDNESARAKELKVGDQLRASQEVQCKPNARVRIRFHASGAEKDINEVRPRWYVVPNVPAVAVTPRSSRPTGRRKGRPDPAMPQPTPVDEKAQVNLVRTRPTNGFDAADLYWKTRTKRFLLVAASKTEGANTNLPFTSVDAKEVAKTLVKLGYEPLGPGLLEGENATRENFVSELQKVRTLPASALVVIYYSGHAVADPSGRELWLQLYGQKKFGDHYGLSIDDLIGSARGESYRGELSLILDTCFSGAAANSTQLKESDNTVVVASSSYQQPSVSMFAPTNTEVSAFTYYLIRGLSDDWELVDGDKDGIIMYTDLGVYIGNRLTERFRDRTLLGPMEPKLFGGLNKNWVAYDAAHARRLDTEPHIAVQLQRSAELQDPEVTMRVLRGLSIVNTDSYFKALEALDDDKFEEAMKHLDAAEKEGRISLAQIYWARADVKFKQNQFGIVREYLGKAVELTRDSPNRDLVSHYALSNFILGNWAKAEELFGEALLLPQTDTASVDKDDQFSPQMLLFFISMLNLIQGDMTEADLYLKRLRAVDTAELGDEESAEAKLAVAVLEFLSDVIQNKLDVARRKLESLRRSESFATASADWKQILNAFIRPFEKSLTSNSQGAPEANATEHFRRWETALQQGDVKGLFLLLNQTQILVGSNNSLLNTKESDDLLERTVKLAHQRKDEKPRKQVRVVGSIQIEEIIGDEREFVLEGAMLLIATGELYALKGDTAKAEKAFKEGIMLQQQDSRGVAMSFSAVVQLAQLYQQAHRYAEAEAQIKNLLKVLQEPLGEENLYACMLQVSLGKLYEDWNRPQDAEASYRESLRLALALGPNSIVANEARQTLADFLAANDEKNEASQLYETAIRSIEQKFRGNSPLSDELSDLYLSLSKTYYEMGSFDLAEKSLAKTHALLGETVEPDIVDMLDCLQWQWATAVVLKKRTEADAFYRRMQDLIEPEIAKPEPHESLGEELRQLAYWFEGWDVDKSENLFQFALRTQEKVFGAETTEAADVWISWAEVKAARNQYGTANTYLDKAQRIFEKQAPPAIGRISYAKYLKGVNHYRRRQFSEAKLQLEESMDLLLKVEPSNEDFYKHQWPNYMLAVVERNLKNYDRAHSIATSVLTLDQNTQPLHTEYVLADLLELAVIARLRGREQEADVLLKRAAQYLEGRPVDDWLRHRAKLTYERGMLALVVGNARESETLLREAVTIGMKDPRAVRFVLADWMDDLALVLRQRKKEKEAGELEESAKKIRDQLNREN